MARPLRIEYEGALYHIATRGNERRNIYFSRGDYEKFFEYVKEAIERHGIILYAYVLMSNHYHLLIETSEANLSKVMHHINSSYTMYINKKRKRSGHLFQGRYKAIVVDRDNYLMELSRYIHLNPVRAKIVESPEEYTYSSYKYYVTKGKNDLLYVDFILDMMSRDRSEAKKKYRIFVESAIGKELENPMGEVYGGMILGSKRFIKKILKQCKKEYMSREEVSHRRALWASYGMEEALQAIAEELQIRKEDISKDREARKIAIFIIKKHTGITNRMIGEYFGGLSYSAISKVVERFEGQMKRQRKLHKKVVKIERKVSHVKG